MPSQQLSERTITTPARHEFRAATLEEAVELATEALGPNIEIVEANRIRRGGVGGFFATDLGVEVLVETTDTASTRPESGDDLLAQMRRLGIDVDELDQPATDTRDATEPLGLDALIADAQRAEQSFATRTRSMEQPQTSPPPSFLERLEQEMRTDDTAPRQIEELPRSDRRPGASPAPCMAAAM